MQRNAFSRRRLMGAFGMLAMGTALSSPLTAALAQTNGRLKVVCTLFPPCDFVREIGGERVDAVLLLKPGQEAHTYEPTPQDIKTIASADLFIYTGGENDTWVEGLLDSLGDKSPQAVRLLDLVPTVAEEIVEGMEDDGHDHAAGEHSHEHENEPEAGAAQEASAAGGAVDSSLEGDHHGESTAEQEKSSSETTEDDDPAADEHVWTSPKNAIGIVEELQMLLTEIDPEGAKVYKSRTENYLRQLQALDAAYRDMVSHARRKTILVADRFPFRYLAESYGLKYYAAFPGCSTQVRPSAATVAFLVDKVRDEHLPVVLQVANSSPRIAKAVAEPSHAAILPLHAVHNLTPQEARAGLTYLSAMKANLEVLRKALND